MWTRLRHKLTFLFRGRTIERELAEELDFHRQMLEADHRWEGDAPDAAVAARRRMGNVTLAREESRDAWLFASLDNMVRDLRYAFRSLSRNPGFATVAVCTLALGIGANTAIFGLIDAVMMRTLPVRDASELLIVRRLVSYPAFERLRDRNEVFAGVAGTHTLRGVELSVDGQPVGHAEASLVTGNYFAVLGVGTALGRTPTPDDDRAPEASPVAMISYALWTRAFAQSPSVLGRHLRVQGGAPGNSATSGFETTAAASRRRDHATLTIVGVAPEGFLGDSVGRPVDLWIPMMMQPAVIPGRAWLTRSSASWIGVIGRLRPGVTEAQAGASLTVLWRQIRLEDLGASATDENRRALANATLVVEPGARLQRTAPAVRPAAAGTHGGRGPCVAHRLPQHLEPSARTGRRTAS